jgi:hypothetical protein
MKMARGLILHSAFLVLIVIALGCGKESKEDKSEFRIPDSLLTSIDEYKLIRDDYHPVEGGVMASSQIELHYPASPIARYVASESFRFARSGYEKVEELFGKPAGVKLVLIGARDLDEYEFLTRKKWWYYGYIKGDTIYYEPLDILIKRSISEMAVAQKVAQALLLRYSSGRIPIWLREALASYLAKEKEVLRLQTHEFRAENANINPSMQELEESLVEAVDRKRTRIAFYAAYRMLENLLGFASMDDVVKFIDRLGGGSSLDDASREAFGMDYNALLDEIRVDRKDTSS